MRRTLSLPLGTVIELYVDGPRGLGPAVSWSRLIPGVGTVQRPARGNYFCAGDRLPAIKRPTTLTPLSDLLGACLPKLAGWYINK